MGEEMNMFVEAKSLYVMMKMRKMSQNEVAKMLGVSQSYVANKIRLLRFDAAMQERMLAANLTERHARALLRLPPTLWEKGVERIISRHANVEMAERIVDEMLLSANVPPKTKRAKPRGVLRDVKVFYNSVDRAVALLRQCGIGARTERREEEGESCLIIRIPKSG